MDFLPAVGYIRANGLEVEIVASPFFKIELPICRGLWPFAETESCGGFDWIRIAYGAGSDSGI